MLGLTVSVPDPKRTLAVRTCRGAQHTALRMVWFGPPARGAAREATRVQPMSAFGGKADMQHAAKHWGKWQVNT